MGYALALNDIAQRLYIRACYLILLMDFCKVEIYAREYNFLLILGHSKMQTYIIFYDPNEKYL